MTGSQPVTDRATTQGTEVVFWEKKKSWGEGENGKELSLLPNRRSREVLKGPRP